MSGVAFGARADGLVVFHSALGADAARALARVHALEVEAGLVARALLVLGALRVAAGERVAEEVGRARADGAVVLRVAALRNGQRERATHRSTSACLIESFAFFTGAFRLNAIYVLGRCNRRRCRKCRKDLGSGTRCRRGRRSTPSPFRTRDGSPV